MAKKNNLGTVKPKDICGICGKVILEEGPFAYMGHVVIDSVAQPW